jgi:hypothetical protein
VTRSLTAGRTPLYRLSPAAVVLIYYLLDGQRPLLERIGYGVGTGLLVTAAGFMAMMVCLIVVGILRGALWDGDPAPYFESSRVWAGVLLFAVVWTWIHVNHESEIDRALRCVESEAYSDDREQRRLAVEGCIRQLAWIDD